MSRCRGRSYTFEAVREVGREIVGSVKFEVKPPTRTIILLIDSSRESKQEMAPKQGNLTLPKSILERIGGESEEPLQNIFK